MKRKDAGDLCYQEFTFLAVSLLTRTFTREVKESGGFAARSHSSGLKGL